MKKLVILIFSMFFAGLIQAEQVSQTLVYQQIKHKKAITLKKESNSKLIVPFERLYKKITQYSSKLFMLSLVIIGIGVIFAVAADIMLGALIIGIGVVVLLFAVL